VMKRRLSGACTDECIKPPESGSAHRAKRDDPDNIFWILAAALEHADADMIVLSPVGMQWQIAENRRRVPF
jgi:hypothetical protein